MHADTNHPGLKLFREIKARDRAIAIIRNEVKKNNPEMSHKQAQEIAKASYAAQTRGVSSKARKPQRSQRPTSKIQRREDRGLTVKLYELKTVSW